METPYKAQWLLKHWLKRQHAAFMRQLLLSKHWNAQDKVEVWCGQDMTGLWLQNSCRIKSRLIALLLRVACISYGKARRAIEIFFHIEAVIALFASIYCFHLSTVQSSVKTFLPGFGNDRLKYCVIVHFWGGQRNILRVILPFQRTFETGLILS